MRDLERGSHRWGAGYTAEEKAVKALSQAGLCVAVRSPIGPASASPLEQTGEHQPTPHRTVGSLIHAHPLVFTDCALLHLETAFESQCGTAIVSHPKTSTIPAFPRQLSLGVGNAISDVHTNVNSYLP